MKLQLAMLLGFWALLIGAMLYAGYFVKLDIETALIYVKHFTA